MVRIEEGRREQPGQLPEIAQNFARLINTPECRIALAVSVVWGASHANGNGSGNRNGHVSEHCRQLCEGVLTEEGMPPERVVELSRNGFDKLIGYLFDSAFSRITNSGENTTSGAEIFPTAPEK